MRRTRVTTLLAAIVVVLASSCSTPTSQDLEPDVEDNLIVSGDRVGDLMSIGTPGSVVEAMTGSETVHVPNPERTTYIFRDAAEDIVRVISVCASRDVVTEIYIMNHPENERFETPEGLSVTSSEADVLAALGAPDRTLEASNSRIHDYVPISDQWFELGFSFWLTDATRANWIGVRGRCE